MMRRSERRLDEALAAPRPCLLEVMSDPEVPPLPPHIKFDQAIHFWRSIYRGDPSKWHMIADSFKELVSTYAAKITS